MNLAKLSWLNIRFRPWSTVLNVLLFSTGVVIITMVILFKQQMEQQFQRNLAGIDLVVGAKGSPLQLILSSIYHVDYPTGNILLNEAQQIMDMDTNLVKQTIPMSLGDNYKGYRIIGTTTDYVDLYEAEIAEGTLWDKPLEVVLGALVADELGLKLGDAFESQHSFSEHGEHHSDHNFVVVGILRPSHSVLDQLILTDLETIWDVHHHVEVEEDTGEVFDPLLQAFSHPAKDDGKEITSLLVEFKSSVATLTVPRDINENTNMQAASPAIESSRLFSITGAGADGIKWLAIIIMALSAVSVLISLYTSLNDRRYEMALMRVAGASQMRIFVMVLLEGLFTAWLGLILGIGLGHFGMNLLAGYLQESYRYSFTGWQFAEGEWWLIIVATGIGIVAAILPAWSAIRTDISETLAKK